MVKTQSQETNSLVIHAKLAVLRSYVENEAILESIPLFRGSKCKQTKQKGSEDCYETISLPFYKIIVSFFFFFNQDVNKTSSNCAIIGCNLSKEHKLTQYKTQNGEPNYVDKFFFTFFQELPVQKLGDRHPNTIELAS